ncbi:MAG: hypothetical protein KTR32_07815 [Granulosicoccus sp.]|nr:hypothetical protein [Granulosicoccus sp.]
MQEPQGNQILPAGYIRNVIFVAVMLVIVLKGDSLLFHWLGFGDGKKVSNLNNAVLNAFWTSGVMIFATQCMLWIEAIVKKVAR